MQPRPPTSTLFPYTTLFRSQLGVAVPPRRQAALDPGQVAAELPSIGAALGASDHGAQHRCHLLVDGKDRKSTRLNSSHTVISYAVFCLKKNISYFTNRAVAS